MVWLTTFGMLSMPVLVALYWRLPPAWRPWLLALGGAMLLGHDGWSSVAAWSALLAWLTFICGPQWRRPAMMQTLGLAGVLLAFIAYQYAKASHGLAAYLGYAFVSLKAWHLIAEHGGGGIARDGRAGTTLGYLLFPPTLAIGPVQRYDAFRMELLRARWDRQLASHVVRLLQGSLTGRIFAELQAKQPEPVDRPCLARCLPAAGGLWLELVLAILGLLRYRHRLCRAAWHTRAGKLPFPLCRP